jgi:DNA-binding sugar fermentation-stimulating protein
MRFTAPLIPATLLRRYKRFLADVVLPGGEEITAHVANPGAMTGLATPGARVFLSRSDKANRKLPYSSSASTRRIPTRSPGKPSPPAQSPASPVMYRCGGR